MSSGRGVNVAGAGCPMEGVGECVCGDCDLWDKTGDWGVEPGAAFACLASSRICSPERRGFPAIPPEKRRGRRRGEEDGLVDGLEC
jgi:hypothetical protein